MLIIPQIRLTALIFTIGHPVSRITLIPPSFICPIPCLLSGDVRQETKHQDLKARHRPSLPPFPRSLAPLDCPPQPTPELPSPPIPPTPAALLISLIFNLTWTVINGSSNEGREEHKGYFAGARARSLALAASHPPGSFSCSTLLHF